MKGLHHEKGIKRADVRLLGLVEWRRQRRRSWAILKHPTRLSQSLERQGEAPVLSFSARGSWY